MAGIKSGRLVVKGVSFLFGDDTPFPLTGFKRGAAGTRAQDVNRVRRHGRSFGRDLLEGPTHEVSLVAIADGSDRLGSVASLMADFESLMNAASDLGHGELTELWIGDRYCLGRPRDLDVVDDGVWDGTAEYGFTFAAESKLWYGPSTSTRVRFSVPETGGLRFPARAPFTFDSGPTADNGTIRVDGDVPSFPVFEIHGPVRDPAVDVKGVGELIFDVVLAHDQVLRVDCGAGAVRRDGAPLPGALSSRGARLSDMRLAPGSYSVVLRGYDPTGTGELSVQVAPAFTSFVGGRS